jgi:epoxide hydrolase-like predicted phosphatase
MRKRGGDSPLHESVVEATGMIKAVIFDWGEVLIEHPAGVMLDYFSEFLGVGDKELNRVCAGLVTNFQRGFISEKALWGEVCRRLAVAEPGGHDSLWKEAFRRAYKPRKEMFELLAALKHKGLKVGLLSNTEMPAVDFFREQHYEVFDQTVFSCVEGVVKPERGIYEIALERLEVRASECIFVDDRKDFIAGARRVGLITILFQSPQQVEGEVRSYLDAEKIKDGAIL